MERLKRLREARGLSQIKLAQRADLNPATVNQIEGGKRAASPGTLHKLAVALDVSLYELLEGEPRPKAESSSLEPSLNDVLAGERRTAGVEVGEAYFVPLEEGEEEDTVTLRIYYAQLFEGGEPILQAMREASPEEAAEAAKMRQQREKSGRVRE